ncbi:alpha/beta hydrolase [Pseudarthrobacter sp. AL07]|uniref:alpha/beta fold hydrolase n=1 Tax=unclassified Pseudarthrobacter TaxID=2647000 RepID=UPI00249C3C60|nr:MULTISPECIES: alpha/beta hydrolase [unclassified Pseudarthrobacter]MDI3194572.1 alpha/beta hydrolase [Pseudarthrobacter sp. AL20]MDI3208560.1 alpha/beta hydrolase [Pseudarthrobacter sp. AL07]
MKLSDGEDIESGGLAGRLYRSVAPASDMQRPTYVLLHGIGVSHRYFVRLHRVLALTADVYSFDLPGFGDAPRPRRQVPVGEYAAFVRAALTTAGVTSCVVIGHSMGTQHAAELALQEPELVDAVVLMGPVVDPRRASVARQALALTRDAMFSESPSANAIVFADYFRAGPRWYLTELPVMMQYPLETRIRGISQPLLVLRGGQDPVAGRHWCRRLASQAPQGSMSEIPGHGHVFQHTAPGPAAAAISSWAPIRRRGPFPGA